jgi:hypothetical protein
MCDPFIMSVVVQGDQAIFEKNLHLQLAEYLI